MHLHKGNGAERNVIMKNIVEPIKSKRDLERIEEFLSLRNKRNRLIFAFGINTGLRVSDILSLNVEDVEGKSYVEIKEKKTGKYKRFPLNAKLKALIKDYLMNERCKSYSLAENEPLFLWKKHCRLDRSQVYRFLNEACKQLGIVANVGTHTMRKSFGYHFYKQYNDIALLQKILNHSSPAMTLKYIGVDSSINNFNLEFEL